MRKFWVIALYDEHYMSEEEVGELGYNIYHDYDNIEVALVDVDTNTTIMKNDNYHGKPSEYMQGFFDALDHMDVEYNVEKQIAMSYKDYRSAPWLTRVNKF